MWPLDVTVDIKHNSYGVTLNRADRSRNIQAIQVLASKALIYLIWTVKTSPAVYIFQSKILLRKQNKSQVEPSVRKIKSFSNR